MAEHTEKLLRLKDLTLIEAVEKEFTAAKQEKTRLEAQREELKRGGLAFKRERQVLHKILEWAQETELPLEAKRLLTAALISRVEIPTFDAYEAATAVIKWLDGSDDTTFTIEQRKPKGWTFAETQTLKHYVETGASQVILSAALPSRPFEQIRMTIFRRYGSRTIPHTRTVYKSETFAQYLRRAHDLILSGVPEIWVSQGGTRLVQFRDIAGAVHFMSETGELAENVSEVSFYGRSDQHHRHQLEYTWAGCRRDLSL
jgi:hypothetical protein